MSNDTSPMSNPLDIINPGAQITTRSGHVDLLNPDPRTIRLDEMAMSLSRQPRYTGHSDVPVSIAQHLLICDLILTRAYPNLSADDNNLRAAVLLHDAHEAYTGDICRPLKQLINRSAACLLEGIERDLDRAIYLALGLSATGPADGAGVKAYVKVIDNAALAVETKLGFPRARDEWQGLADLSDETVWRDVLEGATYILTQDNAERVAAAWELVVSSVVTAARNEAVEGGTQD